MSTTSSPSSTSPAGRHIALLIDADNISRAKLAGVLTELSKYGTPNIRRAYGDWTSPQLKNWKTELHEFAIRPMQQFSYSTGKNATDISMVIDAMELLYTQRIDAFCIVSSDADFTPLVMHLRAAGHEVYGFGERKAPPPFVNACTTFLYFDTLDGKDPEPEQPVKKPASSGKTKPPPASLAHAKPTRTIAQDTKLVTILRGAVVAAAAARDDGWALLATAGSAAKRLAPIDPRNYGAKNFPALFEATGLFDIIKGKGGHAFVADKRNVDRTPKPTE